MKIVLKELFGEDAITNEDGQKVYEKIHPELLAGRQVELDFSGVKVVASLFLNPAIGQLLKDIPSEKLNELLKITSFPVSGNEALKKVIDNSKAYYSNPQYRKAINDVLKEHGEEK